MDETTNPGAPEVVTAPEEQDFSDFEKSRTEQPEEAPEIEEPTEFADDDTPEEEASPEPSEDDEEIEEIEHRGRKYKVPKGAAMMQADYTRKTQEVAEQRKKFEALTNQAEELSEAEQKAQDELGKVKYRMAQLEAADWSQADQMTLMQAQIEHQNLARSQEQLGRVLNDARTQRLSLAEQETALRLEEGRKTLVKEIPNFHEKAPKLADFAIKEYGFSADELASVEDPRFFLALNRLVDLETEARKQQQAAKAAKQNEVKPVQTLKGNQGRRAPRADTNDFLAFEKLAKAKIRTR